MQSSTTFDPLQGSWHPADGVLAGRPRPPKRPPEVTWPRPRQRPGRGTGYRVLCVDDDQQVLKYLEELFAMHGFDVDVALEGTSGRELALAHRYDAMVIDLRLRPEMTGLDVIRAVRATGQSGAILVFTAFPSHESAIEATQLGATYLVKTEVKGAAIVDAVVKEIAARMPTSRPLFRTTPGPSPVVLDLVRAIDIIRAGSTIIEVDAVRTQLRQRVARVLAWFDLAFLEFVAAAEAFRMLGDPARDVAFVLPVVAQHLDTAARRGWIDIDSGVRRIVEALVATGTGWRTIDETAVGKIASVTVDKLPDLLDREVGLSWPWTRWTVAVRRALLELAGTDEQSAQIAFKIGFSSPTRLNDAFKEYFQCTPTEYRQLLRNGSRNSTTS